MHDASKPAFVVKVYEPVTDDAFDRSVADAMRLPFTKGWEFWGVYQNNKPIFLSTDYELVERTATALNNLMVTTHADAVA